MVFLILTYDPSSKTLCEVVGGRYNCAREMRLALPAAAGVFGHAFGVQASVDKRGRLHLDRVVEVSGNPPAGWKELFDSEADQNRPSVLLAAFRLTIFLLLMPISFVLFLIGSFAGDSRVPLFVFLFICGMVGTIITLARSWG